jgi:glutathione-regulated potassium-efflux system ancillary protein KefC
VLELAGQSPEAARENTAKFRQHNLELFEKLHPHYKDQAKLISVVKEARSQLEEQMAQERAEKARF